MGAARHGYWGKVAGKVRVGACNQAKSTSDSNILKEEHSNRAQARPAAGDAKVRTMSNKGSLENDNNTSKYNYDKRRRHADNEKLCNTTKARPRAKLGHTRTPKTAMGTREAQERLGKHAFGGG